MNNFGTYCRITFWRIIKSKSTEQFSGIPYVMTLLNCLLSAWYIIYASCFINRVLFNFYCFFSSFVTFFIPLCFSVFVMDYVSLITIIMMMIMMGILWLIHVNFMATWAFRGLYVGWLGLGV